MEDNLSTPEQAVTDDRIREVIAALDAQDSVGDEIDTIYYVGDTPIVPDYPPNYADILAVLPAASAPGIVFAYDGAIYNPAKRPLAPEIVKHEKVHFAQQEHAGSARAWWRLYLTDPAFRYAEELAAHKAELRARLVGVKDRNQRAVAKMQTVLRLCHPMYGKVKGPNEVLRDLREFK